MRVCQVHIKKPLLVKGDGPMQRLRRWYYQFYSSGEPKISLAAAPSSEQHRSAGVTGLAAGRGAECPAAGAADW